MGSSARRRPAAMTEGGCRTKEGIGRSGPVVAALAGAPESEPLIRAAAELAAAADAELIGLHVVTPTGGGDAAVIDEQRRLLEELGGQHVVVEAADAADAIVAFALRRDATRIVLGASRRNRVGSMMRPSVLEAVARRVDIDVHLVEGPDRPPPRRYRPPPLDRRRVVIAWLGVAVGVPAVTAALIPFRSEEGLPASLLIYLLVVVAAAATGAAGPAAAAAIAGFLAGNWFFTPPFHTVNVAGGANLLTLATFIVVAGVISFLVGQVAHRSAEAVVARTEAEALARAAAAVAGDRDPLGALTERLRATFAAEGVAVLSRVGDTGWTVEAAAGARPPRSPAEASATIPISDDVLLALRGAALNRDDRRVLEVFATQLATALERRRLAAEASEAAVLAETDRLRTALLRAVSHDLRTPLASIKASVSSLRQDDIAWSPSDAADFLGMIEEETDRLDRLIGNLLDMGRLQADALHVARRAIALEEVVPAAIDSLAVDARGIDLAISEHSPPVLADPTLLERALANIISNAVRWNAGAAAVRVEAADAGEAVEVRIIDHGPGVAVEDRPRMFQPFQRLGDQSADTGVGLGLAVAYGFIDAMDGRIDVEDTPGGGLTIVVGLPGART